MLCVEPLEELCFDLMSCTHSVCMMKGGDVIFSALCTYLQVKKFGVGVPHLIQVKQEGAH
jgi:NADH:ubiquinone oxidoreductase subunit E